MKYIWKIAFSLFFIIIGWMLANWHSTFKQDTVIPEVVTINVDKGSIQERVNLSTKVSEEEIMNLTSAVAAGVVERIYVKIGDYVERGETLIELRKEELINNIKKEELHLESEKRRLSTLTDLSVHPDVIEKDEEIKRIEWEISEVNDTLEDTKELYSKGATSYREIEKEELEKKKLEMNLNISTSKKGELIKQLGEEKKKIEIDIPAILYRIKELNAQIKACNLTSPIKGMVRKVGVEKNQKVEYGSLLISIATTDELVARGSLKESNFFLVKAGQKVELSSDELGKRFIGEVIKTFSYSTIKNKEAEEGDAKVICSIDNPNGLVVGLVLSAEIIIKESGKEFIVIPPEALYED